MTQIRVPSKPNPEITDLHESRGLRDARVLRDAADAYVEAAVDPGLEQIRDGDRLLTVAGWLRVRADRITGGTDNA